MMRRSTLAMSLILASQSAQAASAAYNYTLHCSGCHRSSGESASLSRVPPIKDSVGHLVRDHETRLYLANVPGIASSGLGAEDTASLLNWLVKAYGGTSTPQTWKLFDAEEVEALRAAAPPDIFSYRKEIRDHLAAQGFSIRAYP